MSAVEKFRASPELTTIRLFAELAGILGLGISAWRWVESGSLARAVAPVLPIFGWATLATWFLLGVMWLILGTGAERLLAVVSLMPLGYLAIDGSVTGLGGLAIFFTAIWACEASVDLVRLTQRRTK
jgi:hypothetical protein